MKTLVRPHLLLLFALAFLLQACNLEKINPDLTPEADFVIGNDGCTASCIVSFDASASVNASSFAWNFGDGSTGTGESTTHTYDAFGDFAVTLTVTGSDGSLDSLTKTVTIIQDSSVRASFMIDSVSCQGFAPAEIFVTNLSQFATNFSWVWGDGTASQNENPGSHVFNSPGVYNIKLTVDNGMGESDDTTVTYTVLSPNTFQMEYGQSNYYEEGWGMAKLSNGDFFLVGYYTDTALTDFNATSTMSRIKPDGSLVWRKDYPSSNKISAYRLGLETNDGGLAVVGLKTDNDTSQNRYDIHFVKTDSDGNIIIDKTYGDQVNSENGNDIIKDENGNFYIISRKYVESSSTYHPWVLKIDQNGNILWNKLYGTSDTRSNYANALELAPNGGMAYLGYRRRSGANDNDVWFVITDNNGNVQIEKTYGTVADESDYGTNLTRAANGDYILVGYTYGKGAGSSDIWVLRVDPNGNLIWDKTFGTMSSEGVGDVIEDKDGNILIAGRSYGQGIGSSDFWIIKTDANGNMIWDEAFGGPRYDTPYSVAETDDCGYAIYGSLSAPSGQNNQGLFIKMDTNGNVN